MSNELTRTRYDVTRQTNGEDALASRPQYQPRTDIYETDENVVILAEMPGVAQEGVDVTLERRMLTIRGRAAAVEHKGYRQVYAEYGDGDYHREFAISEDIDESRISANQKNGVLTLVLPKAEPAKAKKITVKAG